MQTTTRLNFLLFLSLFLFVSVVWTCVNDCSGHGSCNAGTCICNNGYGGDDCSVLDTSLTSGVIVTGNLKTYQWHYYHISVPDSGDTLIISVNQTSRLGDVDVYVKLGSYPTGDNYDLSDTSDSNSISLSVNPAQSGTYYVGLYGFWDVSYNISATINVNCVPACQNGVCQNHVCSCYSPYFGTDCSIYDLEVESGRTYYGVVDTQKWIYYHINVEQGQYLKVEMNQAHPAPNDIDVYLKQSQRPSMWSFNYINATTDQTTIMVVETPAAGLWEIGLYGYVGDSYSLIVTAAVPPPSICQNNCSGTTHGTCHSSTCTCLSGYSGPSCNNYTQNIELDTQYSGYVASAQWNYYFIKFFTSNSLQISVSQGTEGDVDLYVRQDDYPTRVVYTYADLTIHKTYTVNITNPGDEYWYIGFYGWIPASYSFSVSQIVTCSCSSSQHGSCPPNNTNCVCNIGWAGYQCSQVSQHIQNGQVYSYQSVAKNGWNYYYFTTNSHAAIITMLETSTSNFLWLFVSETGYPTLDSYSEANYLTDYHEIAITWDEAVDRMLFIGVYGASTITTDDPVLYSITAWGAPI